VNFKISFLTFCACTILFITNTADARTVTREEEHVVSASGITAMVMKNMSFADIIYQGSPEKEAFTIVFKRTVKTDDSDKSEEILSQIDLDITTSGNTVIITLKKPDKPMSGWFNRMVKRGEWSVFLYITGPSSLNLKMNADFSKIQTFSTSGNMTVNADFSKTVIKDHTGQLDAKVTFGDFTCVYFDGVFHVDSDFSKVNINLAGLTGNSSAKTSFGDINLRIPENTGAELYVDKNLGSVDFDIKGSWRIDGGDERRRILNDGGPRVDLHAEFGHISVKDISGFVRKKTYSGSAKKGEIPLYKGEWWRFKSGDNTMTLRVKSIRNERGKKIAALSFDKNESSPFESIEVYEADDGLYLCSIKGRFFGRDLSGVRFDPPRLWLPWGEEQTNENVSDLLGTVLIADSGYTLETPAGTFNDVISYTIDYPELPVRDIKLAPGVGFVSFDEYTLQACDKKIERPVTPPPPPEPEFEKGVVQSITIRGTRILESSDVTKLVDITEGDTYTRKQISDEVDNLPKKNKFINNAYYKITRDGKLTINVSEAKISKRDFDLYGSFSRIGGVGLGPTLTINSLIGPVSKLAGGAQYHWGNREWTYNAFAEKSFSKLTFGATYRLDYESHMDWAIPPYESYLNAFILGLETKNYFQVEGTSGYISLGDDETASLKFEYFEEDFSSLYKHTNWSFFNHRHKKDDNLPLPPLEEGRLTGMRLVFDISHHTSLTNSRLIIEAERALDKGTDTIGKYDRLFGNTMHNWRLSPLSLLKLRLAGGYSKDILPGQKSFKLGGINTLRGFDFESIGGSPDPVGLPINFISGGNRMALCNIDYFIGHKSDFRFILFADAGGVWHKGEDIEIKGIKRNIGIGVASKHDFFGLSKSKHRNVFENRFKHLADGWRINWAVPVGNEPHVSHWTVNFVRTF